MIANADITLITLLQHKRVVFEMIDHADSSGVKGTREFSVTLYHHLIDKALKSQSERERRRLSGILSLENLNRHHLLGYWDKTADTFIFQQFIIAMFRHLEGHRLQELSDAELNGLHTRLKEIHGDVARGDFPWFKDDIEYKERFGYIITTLRDINTRIDQNIASLKGQAKTLAELADSEMGADLLRAEQVHHALQKIFDLVERYIRPTLRFLNPDLDWKGKGNSSPLQLFSQIMERFENRERTEERAIMSRIYWNLLQSSEEISIVRKSLDVYINLYEHQRRLYNAIEEKYNSFYSQIKELQDGKLKGNRLDPQAAIMGEMAIVQGLKSHVSAQFALINLPTSPGSHFLDEHLRVRLERVKNQRRHLINAEAKPTRNDPKDVNVRRRFNALYIAASRLTLEPGKDLYLQIHEMLSTTLDDYTLADIVDAYSIAVLDKLPVRIDLSSQKSIAHHERRLTYFPRIHQREGLDHD